MDIKPWEPKTIRYVDTEGWMSSRYLFDSEDRVFISEGLSKGWPCVHVTLANGQRIIVRALSDERKAARAAMKEAVS